jgi:hypothetical protein
MARGKKLITVRKPRLRITPKGVKVTNPSMRIGGKTGINVSKSGMSASHRGKLATFTTGRLTPKKLGKSGCSSVLLLALGLVILALARG